jgi:hypothetical protein
MALTKLFPSIIAIAIIANLPLTTHGQIAMTNYFEILAQETKNRIFIEILVEQEPDSVTWENQARIEMLANLFRTKNPPPNLVSALKVALPNATITVPIEGEIAILHNSFAGKRGEVFENTVEIDNFTGRISTLLASLNLQGVSTYLDQSLSIPIGVDEIAKVSKMDLEISEFSFNGSLRSLFRTLAKKYGPLTGYYVSIFEDSPRVTVRFLPL